MVALLAVSVGRCSLLPSPTPGLAGDPPPGGAVVVPPDRMTLNVSNGSTLAVDLVVNGIAIERFQPGGGAFDSGRPAASIAVVRRDPIADRSSPGLRVGPRGRRLARRRRRWRQSVPQRRQSSRPVVRTDRRVVRHADARSRARPRRTGRLRAVAAFGTRRPPFGSSTSPATASSRTRPTRSRRPMRPARSWRRPRRPWSSTPTSGRRPHAIAVSERFRVEEADLTSLPFG